MNRRETKVAAQLMADGWTVLRSGWPDFLCVRNGTEVMAVEVKRMGQPLSAQQDKLHRVLNRTGLKVVIIQESAPSVTDNSVLFHVRLPKSLTATVKKWAAQENRTLTQQVVRLLSRGTKRWYKEQA